MNEKQKISIVLPTHNGAAYVLGSITSCLQQSYDKIELIVVDDASTDNTAAIVRTVRDPRTHYLRNENNVGLPRALNRGFAAATGELLTWTSDDNFYAPDALARMADYLSQRDVSFVYSDYYSFAGDDWSAASRVSLPDSVNLSRGNHIGACFLYTSEVANRTGLYDPEVETAEDYDYWLRVSKVFSMGHLAEPVYFYRLHERSLTSTRLHEIRIVDVLVRMKNGIMTAEAGTEALLGSFAGRYRGLRRLDRYVLGLRKRGRVMRILQGYGDGRLALSEVKATLFSVFRVGKGVEDE